MYYHFLRKVNR
jgi:hypothetical protein